MAIPSNRTLRRDQRLQELLALNTRLTFEGARLCADAENPDPLCQQIDERALEILQVGLSYLQRAYRLTEPQAEQLFIELGQAAMQAHHNLTFFNRVTLDMALTLPLPCRQVA